MDEWKKDQCCLLHTRREPEIYEAKGGNTTYIPRDIISIGYW